MRSEGIRSTIDVMPKNGVGLSGAYAIEVLGPVEGQSCLAPMDPMPNTATIAGFEPTRGDLLTMRAEGAALYDAMLKARGADTLLVTWVKIVSDGPKKCVTVHARGVRLRQGAVDPEPPAAEAPPPTTPAAPSVTPAAPPAP